jgi:ribosomal-protein-alanine N-acetyltransferase
VLPPESEIARAVPADLDALERIERACFDVLIAFSRRQLRGLLASRSVRVWVLRHEGQVAADAIALCRRAPGGITARIYSLAVLPEHRGKAFGKAILGACLEDLRSAEARRVLLEVGVDNASAASLYESFGFRKIGLIPDYYAPGLDAWKMRLDL